MKYRNLKLKRHLQVRRAKRTLRNVWPEFVMGFICGVGLFVIFCLLQSV